MSHQKLHFMVLVCFLLLAGCSEPQPESQAAYGKVDELYSSVFENLDLYEIIAEIDHSRLAAESGEVTPPARVVLFSDPETNTAILQHNPLAGLDLPFRVLAFSDAGNPRVISTPAGFLERRHGLQASVMERYQAQLTGGIYGVRVRCQSRLTGFGAYC